MPRTADEELLKSVEHNGFMTDELSEAFRIRLDDYYYISFHESDAMRIEDKDFGKVCA